MLANESAIWTFSIAHATRENVKGEKGRGGGVGVVVGWTPPHRLLLIVMADEIEIGRGGTKRRT